MLIKDKITLLKKQLKGNLNKSIKLILNSGKEEIGIIESFHETYIIFNTNHGKITILDFDAWEIMKTEFYNLEKDKFLNEKINNIIKEFNDRKLIKNLNLKPPDFTFPNDFNLNNLKKTKEIKKQWDKFSNLYHFYHKSNNLSQLLSLANDFIDLSQKFPNISQIHYNCGCILFESGFKQYDKALNFLERALELEKLPKYAFNIACTSINLNLDLKTHEMLSLYFKSITPTQDIEAWYTYCHLSNYLGKFESLIFILDSIFRVEKKKEDINLLVESILYFLHIKDFTEKFKIGIDFLTGELNYNELKLYIKDCVSLLLNSIKKRKRGPFKKPLSKILEDPGKKYEKGSIFNYKRERGFGFLRKENAEYFFHKSAIIDSTLLKKLNNHIVSNRNQIIVLFEKTIGKKGLVAINVSTFRTTGKSFNLATQLAQQGKYSQAINIMKIVLNNNPNYPNAMNYYEKWRTFSRDYEIPRGSNPYARAKRAEILDEDFLQAENFYKEAIKQDDNTENAIKDLLNLLKRLDRPLDAIDILKFNDNKIKNRKFYDQQLLSLYQKTNQYELLIDFLYKKYESTKNKFLQLRLLNQIGNVFLQQKNYKNALEIFKELIYSDRENIDAKKKLAISLINLKKLDEAERLLKRITDITLDNETIRILEALREAKVSGKPLQDDFLAIEIKLTDFYGEISKFTKFFLELCDYSGVNPEFIKVNENGRKSFIGDEENSKSEINKLKQIAKSFGTTRPLERSKNYLSAAKIAYEREEDPSQFFRYLGRSFASKGDSVILENGHLDAARAWYSEALSIYDHVRIYEKYERDAENALNMFIYSFLGQSRVPKPSITIPQISATLHEVLGVYPEIEKLFDYLNYLIIQSKYAGSQILHALNETETLKKLTIDYLKQKFPKKIGETHEVIDIIQIWNNVQQDTFQKLHNIASEFQTLMHFELTSVWLEDAVEKLKILSNKLLFDLDRQHLLKLQTIFSNSLNLVKQESFEDRERLLLHISDRCLEIMRDIKLNPTKFSVENIYNFAINFKNEIQKQINELYETTFPQISIRLPDKFDTYIPDKNKEIQIQIVVKNEKRRSPAEDLELILQEDEEFFALLKSDNKLEGSLRGGQQKILEIPIKVTDSSIESKTFSLSIYAQYLSRSNEIIQTKIKNFTIKLYSIDEFEEFDNPYAAYAEGGVVDDPKMFYGRVNLIETIETAILQAQTQSKSIIVYGQKRSGKSSILYHLKMRLENFKNILILDLSNIASVLDDDSNYPFFHQILWSILYNLKDAIEESIEQGYPKLKLKFPDIYDFFKHPSPFIIFNEIFKKYKKSARKIKEWENRRIVLLIDEFSYLFGLILEKKLSKLFMKNWKAILQSNYFNVVLAGQDIMPKFKNMFPNEFGTTQDEKVSYLKKRDALKLIDEPIKISGTNGESRYRENAIDLIYDLTAGSPFYIQLFCNRLVEYMNRKHTKYVTDADIDRIKNDLIRGVSSLGIDKFDNLIDSGDSSENAIKNEDILNVLRVMANNSITGPCNRNSITCETKTSIDEILEDLVTRDVISREEGNYYQIRVGLFKEWLLINL